MSLANVTLADSETTLFTCANAGGTAIKAIFITNTDSSARTVTVHVCPEGEAASDENMIMDAESIPANETIKIEGLLLANTDVVSGFASVASVVTASASYLDL
jgi:hypothetical protein